MLYSSKLIFWLVLQKKKNQLKFHLISLVKVISYNLAQYTHISIFGSYSKFLYYIHHDFRL